MMFMGGGGGRGARVRLEKIGRTGFLKKGQMRHFAKKNAA